MKTAKSLSNKDLSFKYIEDSCPGIGFSVSSKYGSAIQRNLFKRRCRSVFRRLFVNRAASVSLIVRPTSKNVSYESILKSFSSIYEKTSA